MARRLLATLALAALIIGAFAARSLAGAPAERGGSQTLDSYCSPTGDFCTEIAERHARLKFLVHAEGEYFDSYRVCVRPPSEPRQCVESRLRRRGERWEGRVDYVKNFAFTESGTYKVVWRLPRSRLGEPLSFEVRTA